MSLRACWRVSCAALILRNIKAKQRKNSVLISQYYTDKKGVPMTTPSDFHLLLSMIVYLPCMVKSRRPLYLAGQRTTSDTEHLHTSRSLPTGPFIHTYIPVSPDRAIFIIVIYCTAQSSSNPDLSLNVQTAAPTVRQPI